MFIPIWLVDLPNVFPVKRLGNIHCLTFISEVSCWITNAHMFLWLSAFSGWGVWQSRAPGGEHGITGIQHCSHSRDGSLLVTLWMRRQPVNMNKLSIPGNASSCSCCCRVPHSAALSWIGIQEAAFMEDLKGWPACKLDLKHLKNLFSLSLCADNNSGFAHSKMC